jgi:hypothetical protein
MSYESSCPSCGRRLFLGDENVGARVKCPACGNVWTPSAPGADVLPEVFAIVADDAARPRLRPEPPSELVAAQPMPSAVRPLDAAGSEPCPECGSALAPDAVLCIQCGFNRQTGKRLRTVSQRLTRHFQPQPPSYVPRLVIFCVFTLVLRLLFLPSAGKMGFPSTMLLWPVAWGLAALGLGTFSRLTLTRDRIGRPMLLTRQWVAFLPGGRSERDLSIYTTIRLGHKPGGSVLGFLLAFLLIGVFALLLRRDTFTLEIAGELPRDRDDPHVEPVALYRGPSEERMKALGKALEEVAGLRYG